MHSPPPDGPALRTGIMSPRWDVDIDYVQLAAHVAEVVGNKLGDVVREAVATQHAGLTEQLARIVGDAVRKHGHTVHSHDPVSVLHGCGNNDSSWESCSDRAARRQQHGQTNHSHDSLPVLHGCGNDASWESSSEKAVRKHLHGRGSHDSTLLFHGCGNDSSLDSCSEKARDECHTTRRRISDMSIGLRSDFTQREDPARNSGTVSILSKGSRSHELLLGPGTCNRKTPHARKVSDRSSARKKIEKMPTEDSIDSFNLTSPGSSVRGDTSVRHSLRNLQEMLDQRLLNFYVMGPKGTSEHSSASPAPSHVGPVSDISSDKSNFARTTMACVHDEPAEMPEKNPPCPRTPPSSRRLSILPAFSTGITMQLPSFTNLQMGKTQNLTCVRQARECELTEDIQGVWDEKPSEEDGVGMLSKRSSFRSSSFAPRCNILHALLCASGIIQWEPTRGGWLLNPSRWYQWTVLLLAILALISSLYQAVVTRTAQSQGIGCLRVGLLSDIALALGSVVGLIALDFRNFGKKVDECLLMLGTYAQKKEFESTVASRTRKDLLVSGVIWAASAVERVRGCGAIEAALDGTLTVHEVMHVGAFLFSTLLLMVFTNCELLVCRTLMNSVDTYCCEVAEHRNLAQAVHGWNVLQAMLRKASGTVEHCFFTIQTTIFATVLLGVFDVLQTTWLTEGHLPALIPSVLITCGMARIYFASAVTDKCANVPSVLNSLSFGCESLDHERQYVVEYIIYSAAGFYVYEVRLTSALSLKIFYLCFVLVFGLTSKAVTDES